MILGRAARLDVVVVLFGELLQPPIDVVRVLFRLALGALTAWCLGWAFTRPYSRRDKD